MYDIFYMSGMLWPTKRLTCGLCIAVDSCWTCLLDLSCFSTSAVRMDSSSVPCFTSWTPSCSQSVSEREFTLVFSMFSIIGCREISLYMYYHWYTRYMYYIPWKMYSWYYFITLHLIAAVMVMMMWWWFDANGLWWLCDFRQTKWLIFSLFFCTSEGWPNWAKYDGGNTMKVTKNIFKLEIRLINLKRMILALSKYITIGDS